MRKYSHLSLEEREKLYALKLQGISLRDIGKVLGRSHTTLGRELKRNAKYGKQYIPCKAHDKAIKRGVIQRYQAPLKNPLIFLYVRKHLRKRWSPETIEGRLPIDFPEESITDETIYRYIYKGKNKRRKFWRYLTVRRKKRMKRLGRKVRRDSRIPYAVSIDLRSKIIERRIQTGHWESDNMEGIKTDRQSMLVTVERVTRVTHITKVRVKRAVDKANSINYRLGVYPKEFRKTITFDNGSENTKHTDLIRNLGVKTYFCHAYHSWEKGTVENTIGRVRRYIPKGTSLLSITDKDIKMIEDKMNNTPRKCLGYKTPKEYLFEMLKYKDTYKPKWCTSD